MAKTVTVNDDLYRFGWMFVYGGKLSKAVKHFAKAIGIDGWEIDDNAYRNAHFCADTSRKSGLIWFKDRKPVPQFVAHECFHGTMYVFAKLDMPDVTEKTEEVFAYYLEWLVTQVHKHTK